MTHAQQRQGGVILETEFVFHITTVQQVFITANTLLPPSCDLPDFYDTHSKKRDAYSMRGLNKVGKYVSKQIVISCC